MTTHPESIPTTWTSVDEDFFKVAWDLFSPEFLYGAGVLLASYDDEPADATPTAAPVVPTAAPVAAPVRVTL